MSYRKQRGRVVSGGPAEDVGAPALGRQEPKQVPTNILVRPLKGPPMKRVKR